MNSYEEFNDETKLYLNKAMDIYSNIKYKDIQKRVKRFSEERNHLFTNLDKKILSLYMAGFLVNGNLKEILDQYDDIKIDDLFSFIDFDYKHLKKLDVNEYEKFYEENFKPDLVSLMKQRSSFYNVKEITPEVIFWFLGTVCINGSYILNYFGNSYNITKYFFSEHPSFEYIENFAVKKGSLQDMGFTKINTIKLDVENIQPLQSDNKAVSFDDEKIWTVLDEIQKKFIGQETAVEHLFYNIVNNQQLSMRNDVNDGERAIIFLDGPTGTGKTAITREITEKLDIQFTASSATNYSSTGYVGGNITDTLKDLYKKANGDLEKAQRGIIVFDEFDKIAYNSNDGLEMKRAVQQQLLDFLGGGKYNFTVGDNFFDKEEIVFDTSKLTFICIGALTNLRTVKTDKKPSIGFENSNEISNTCNYSITPQDLIDIGLERELVGRFNTYLHTEEYSRDDLINILKESSISPLFGFENWISSKGKKLQIEDGVYEEIVNAAYHLNTGARSLQTVVNNIRTHFIKDVLRGKDEVIHLDLDTVVNINESTINRKSRR